MSRLQANYRTTSANLEDIFRRAETFLGELGPKDKVALIHDSDPDGICSATVLLRSMKNLGMEPNLIIASSPDGVKRDGVLVKGFNKIIILDLAPHLYTKSLEEGIKSGISFLIFDHHMVYEMNSEKIYYVNPRLFESTIYMPTSYLVFKYYQRLFDTKDLEWIAAIGTVADYGIKRETEDLLTKFLTKKDYEDVWKSEFGKAAIKLNASISILGAKKCLQVMLKLKSFEKFNKVAEFKKAADKFESELKKRQAEVRRKAEVHAKEGLVISFVETKFDHIASTISSMMSREEKYKGMTFLLFEKKGDVYKIHGRSQEGRVDIGRLFEKLGIGGGHVQAGGASIDASELPKFKNLLIKEIGRISRLKG